MPLYALDDIAPQLPEDGDYWIAPDANLIGKVRLLAGASVWFGVVARGDMEWLEIGERSNVQDLSVLHADPGYPLTIGTACTIGHRAMLHGCQIGDNCLVGMGATILNGAKIGPNCLIGANALIPEGREIPAGSMVLGMPGKVVKDLDAAMIERITKSAQSYHGNGQRFRSGLQKLD